MTPIICGPDLASSLQVGCKLDVAGLHWTPPACFDERLSHSFSMSYDLTPERSPDGATAATFEWFKDANKTQRMRNFAELQDYLEGKANRSEDIIAFTHSSWHPTHCGYITKIGSIAMERVANGETDVHIPDMAGQPSHADHCERKIDEIMLSPEWFTKSFEVRFGFTRCRKLS